MEFDYETAYGAFHKSKPKLFGGFSLIQYLDEIAEIVARHSPESLLDYGSGKGYQYLEGRAHEHWGGLLPYCYDIGVPQLKRKPQQKFDGVICTDMMEHIHKSDIDAILNDIFSSTTNSKKSFVFLGISCRPARKSFNNGDIKGLNVHLTVESPEWWEARLTRFLSDRCYLATPCLSFEKEDTGL